jgi:predicted amidohydrolase
VLAQAPDAETAIVADLDFDTVQSVRKRIPALTRRRTDVYGWTV